MRKIIIKTDSDQPDFFLVSYIRSLFPDCEIQIEKRDGNTPTDADSGSDQNRIVTVIEPMTPEFEK